jgi:polar amino acid transport system ATP-binding protein
MGSEDRWIDVPCIPHAFVVNIGDMLEAATGGLLRATPHRVAQRSSATAGRLSWPFFYDPSFEAEIQSIVPLLSPALQARAAEARASAPARWDGARFGDLDLHGADADVVATLTSSGTKTKYGEYLVKKVSLVFPELAEGLESSKRIHR